MIFVDEATIFVEAGGGGKGCESFYRDKYMRHPRPDGGDGGDGGNVVVESSRSIRTLLDFKFRQHHKGQNGGHASSKGKRGKNGKDCILRVPVGTLVRDDANRLLIKDLDEDGQNVVIAKGGAGGIGNQRRNLPSPPEKGENRRVHFELKLVADVGIIGFPNAGKSTLISSISKVKSKIAQYPFTTKQPVLGFVEVDDHHFVVADLPGIIEGAHAGKGLGDRFLRHAERAKFLVHLLDMASTEGRDPIDDYKTLVNEIEAYGEPLVSKKRLIVANKMDLPEAKPLLAKFKKAVKKDVLSVSAAAKEGLDELKEKIKDVLCQENSLDR